LGRTLNWSAMRGSCCTPLCWQLDTPCSHAGAAALNKELAELFPAEAERLGWLGQPGDVAEAIAWLASGAARFVNGTTLVADGGLLAGLRGPG
jgi:NAD(P)-dependent dehydrogenase (short-subunit alcohol dehydrogenase family)